MIIYDSEAHVPYQLIDDRQSRDVGSVANFYSSYFIIYYWNFIYGFMLFLSFDSQIIVKLCLEIKKVMTV